MIGVNVGGKSLRTIKPQLERLFSCTYHITNNNGTETHIRNFVVARSAHIDWLRNEPQEHGLFENTVRLSQEYVDMLSDHPVPVDLKVISGLRKPMAIDVYWWLTKRVYGLHEQITITWQQLYQQFGSDTKELWKFKQNFKDAVAEVVEVYPCRITLGPQRVTVFPNRTSVPTVAQARAVERRRRREAPARPAERRESPREDVEARWIEVRGWGNVWMTSELFDVGQARAHLEGAVDPVSCPVCAYDERNRALHGYMQESLF